MNMWARYDDEDRDFVHFSAQVSERNKTRRLLASVHIDDLELMFSEEEAANLRERLEIEHKVFCGVSLCL